MNKTMDIKSFWDRSHDKKILSDLSGCGYDETVDFLKVRELAARGNYVLEIGVGLGYVTMGFYEDGLVVSGLDISSVALERVKNYCERVFTIDELEKIPSDYFDLIICHNVVQHVPTDILRNELKHCIRSLKSNGVFAVEFVSTDIAEDTWNVQYKYPGHGLPGFCRTPNYMKNMIDECGGVCELVVDNKCNIGAVKGCHVVHIRRK
jgi:SAM-dependent methyltransferase